MARKLTTKEKHLIALAAKLEIGKKGDVELFLLDLIHSIQELAKGDKPVAGVDFPFPENGKDYILTPQDKKEIAAKIEVPIVKQIIEKRTEVIKEQPIVTEITKVTNEIKEVAVTDTPNQIAEKLNTLTEAVDKSVIRGLEEEIKKLWARPTGGGGRGGPRLQAPADVSSQCDGSNKTFRVGTHLGIVSVHGTDFPQIYRPIIDYTETATGITLTSAVPAPNTGATLIIKYFK